MSDVECVDCTSGNEAGKLGHVACLKRLKEEGVELDAPDSSGWTCAHEAAENGRVLAVEWMCENGVNMALQDGKGRLPAYWAAENGHVECIKPIIAAGFDVNSPNEDGVTPALVAMEAGHVGCVDALMATDCDLEAEDLEPGERPLSIARRLRSIPLDVRLTIALSAPPSELRKLSSAPWLKEASSQEVLLLYLPYACSRDLPAALATALDLSGSFVAEANKIARLDEPAAEQMIEASRTVQQAMASAIATLGEAEREALLTSPGLLRAAINGGCKSLLSDPLVQRVLYYRWRVVLPAAVRELAMRQWVGQESESEERENPPPTQSAALAAFLLSLLRNLSLLLQATLYPPLEQTVEASRELAKRRAALSVRQRNPRGRGGTFMLDGVRVVHVAGWVADEMQQAAREKFDSALALASYEESHVAERAYPLFQPEGKFWVHCTCYYALVFALTVDWGSSSMPWQLCLLAWTGQVASAEVMEQWRHGTSLWRADSLNGFELCSSVLAVLGSGAGVLLTSGLGESQLLAALQRQTLALTVVIMWTTQSMRVLRRFEWLGPYVVAMELMFADVWVYILLIGGPMIGFAAGFVRLFHASELSEECPFNGDELGGTTFALFETMLGGIAADGLMDCLRASPYPLISPVVLDAFLVFIVLLSLNMLIAMMSATFDKVREQLALTYMYLNALAVVSWEDAPAVPPPFQLFGLFHSLYKLVCRWVCHLDSTWNPLQEEQERLKEEEQALGEKLLAAKELPPTAQLREMIMKALNEDAGRMSAQDEKWRSRFSKDLNRLSVKMDAQLAAIESKLLEIEQSMERKLDKLVTLTQEANNMHA